MATHKSNKRLRRTAVNTTMNETSGRSVVQPNNLESNNSRIRDEIQQHQSVSSAQNQGNIEGSTSHDQPEEHRVYDYIVQDSNGNRKRGKTVLADIWNLPIGHQIVVDVNKEMQPVGEEGGVLGAFLGTIAKNGDLCSLSYTRWDHLKKGCNKNNEKMILKEVEARFLYPKASEYWILKSVGFKWKDYKCYLKGKYYNDDEDITILHNRCPTDVDNNQWISLVNFWRSDEGQKRSKRGKESLAKAKAKPISTTGTKSHARVREELKQKLNRSPTRTELYLECHQHENEAEITNQIKNIVAEQGDQSVNLDNDPVSKVLGKDKYGRVRGLGLLGVKPSNFVEPSVPSYCKGLKMSSKDEGAILYYLRELRRCVKNQGATILKLRRKLQEHLGSDFDDSEFDDLSDDLTESGSDGTDSNQEEDFDIPTIDKAVNKASSSGNDNSH